MSRKAKSSKQTLVNSCFYIFKSEKVQEKIKSGSALLSEIEIRADKRIGSMHNTSLTFCTSMELE